MTPPVRHRRTHTLVTTLAAAALAGELVVAAVGTAPAASAQADDPPTADAPAAPASDASGSDVPGSDPEPPAPPEPDEPAAPELPPDASPPEVPAAAPLPEVAVPPPAATPSPAAQVPVRTGYTFDLTPDPSDSRSPRRDDTGEDRAAARTGHDASAEGATRAPTRGGRTPARRRHTAGPAADRRAQRSATPRTLPGAPPAGAAPTEHTVAPGEHLWGIAATTLAELTARPVASLRAEEIAPYWTRLCMLNAPRLRSGDLDLVYPGEVIELPPL